MVGTVVVGVEGTASSHDALVWAARTASARGAVLEIVHATGAPVAGREVTLAEQVTLRGKEVLHEATERAQVAAPGVAVRVELERDDVAPALVRRSAGAELLVVGSHPLKGLERLVGSRSYQIVSAAACPAVVVPTFPPPDARDVVVGIDGSADGQAALMLAAAEADRTGADLVVVHAWEEPSLVTGLEYLGGAYVEDLLQQAQAVLDEAVHGVREQHPDLRVHGRVEHGRPADRLLHAARDAALVVVGCRGRQGLARVLLGSVSHGVVLHAPVPVMVARR